jgi:hypothetical protein
VPAALRVTNISTLSTIKDTHAYTSRGMCRFGRTNQTFDCSSIFDSAYYINTYKLKISKSEAWFHFQDVGIWRGYRFHAGNRIMKIILVTKDEWPLLEPWILYHGKLVGYENIYVISSDTDLRCIDFLATYSKSLGFQYFVSDPSFESIEFSINDLISKLKYSADYVTKIDTDEYLSFFGGSFNNLLSKDRFQEYLNDLVYDGGSYNISYMIQNLPDEASCLSSYHPLLKSNHFVFSSSVARKVILPAPTVSFMDIGNHHSRTIHPFNSTGDKPTKLAIIDFHFQCYEKLMMNNRKGIINRGFILINDTIHEQIMKLRHCGEAFPQFCACASCHKVHEYLNHLLDPVKNRSKYYSHFRSIRTLELNMMREYFSNISIHDDTISY